MSILSNVSAFFRDCYQADNKAIHLSNFFSNKVSSRLMLENSELISGKLLEVPVKTEWGQEVQQRLAIYAKDKGLVCCSFFLIGTSQLAGRKQEIVAPLVLHPAELIQEDDIFYVTIDATKPVINPAFVDVLKTELTDTSGLYEQLYEIFPQRYIGFREGHLLFAELAKLFPHLNLSFIQQYPDAITFPQLESLRKEQKKKDGLVLLPSFGIGMIDKGINTRGILNELKTLTESNTFSKPLKELFISTSSKPSLLSSEQDIYVPALLSTAQEQILEAVRQHALSLVIGPPGTGKSFTIAALAVDCLSKGKTVLIASKNNQAVDVVADKIERDFGLQNVTIRAGRQDYKKQLQARIENLLNGIDVFNIKTSIIRQLKRNVHSISKRIKQLGKDVVAQQQEEIRRGLFLWHYRDAFWQRIRMFFLRRKMEREAPLWRLVERLEQENNRQETLIRELVEKRFHHHVYQLLNNYRYSIMTFLRALKARTDTRKETFLEKMDFDKVLQALPIWIVNASDISRVLPLEAELFDVVIIDEATQCDIASSLPLLQRAKRTVIVGDPRQLRHVSFLSRKQQQAFIQQHGLAEYDENKLQYRDKSLLDIVQESLHSQQQVHFLDEHFRSLPDIIHFSNKHFYNNALKIMTTTPTTLQKQNVYLHHVNGERSAKGYNKQEAATVFEQIRLLIQREATLDVKLCQSIGLLSPFRAQVDYLQKLAEAQLDANDFERHRILIGTPYAFQGEERDVMLLSFAVDDSTHPSTLQYLEKEDVFNVSITRARSAQHLFLSVSLHKLRKNSLFSKYLYQYDQKSNISTQALGPVQKDDFLQEVIALLHNWGIQEIYTAYSIAGIEIDLVAVHQEKTFCIDLIGYPGSFENAISLESWKMLHRVGVLVFALPYSQWVLDKEYAMNSLQHFLQL